MALQPVSTEIKACLMVSPRLPKKSVEIDRKSTKLLIITLTITLSSDQLDVRVKMHASHHQSLNDVVLPFQNNYSHDKVVRNTPC